jgi:hypothetical protein
VSTIALGNFAELIDDVLGRRLVRVAHAKVDNVITAMTSFSLQFIDDIKDVGREPLYARKIFHFYFDIQSTNKAVTGK